MARHDKRPLSDEIVSRDEKILSTSNTRPYPLVVDRASGAELWDVDGNRYIDFMAGIAVTATGHSHPDVVQAIKNQAEKFLHICLSDFYYEIAVDLAERLASTVPFSEEPRMFFTNSGAESVEAAFKLARYHTGRPNMIAFQGAFHGRTMGALSLTGSKHVQKKGFFPLVPGVTHIPYPNPYRPHFNTETFSDDGAAVLDYLEHRVFATTVPADTVAGIIVEPIQGEGGYLVPPRGFLKGLREICDRHGILLIADEIQTGLGRTGKWWAVEHEGVEPDIFTTAKGIASGLPLGAMIARKSVMTWEPGSHGSTFGGNPVSCAASIATLDLIRTRYMDNARIMGEYITDALEELRTRHSVIDYVRGRGLMIGVEVVESQTTRKAAPEIRNAIVDEAFESGLLILGAGTSTIRFIPPMMIEKKLVDEGLNILDDALITVEKRFNI